MSVKALPLYFTYVLIVCYSRATAHLDFSRYPLHIPYFCLEVLCNWILTFCLSASKSRDVWFLSLNTSSPLPVLSPPLYYLFNKTDLFTINMFSVPSSRYFLPISWKSHKKL